MEEIGRIFVKFGVTMFYISFGSIIGGLVGWYDITVPSAIFFVGLTSLIVGCKISAK